jgi:hypothetical protein
MRGLSESRKGLFLSDRQDPSTIPDDADVTAELQIDMSGGVKDITSSPRPSANGDSSTHHSYGERTGSLQVKNDLQLLLSSIISYRVTESVHIWSFQNSTRLRALTSDAYVNIISGLSRAHQRDYTSVCTHLWTQDKANCLNDYLVSTPEDHQTASTGATFFRMSVPHAVVTTGISNLHNFVVRRESLLLIKYLIILDLPIDQCWEPGRQNLCGTPSLFERTQSDSVGNRSIGMTVNCTWSVYLWEGRV